MIAGRRLAGLPTVSMGILVASVFSLAAFAQGTEPLFRPSGQVPGAANTAPAPSVQPPAVVEAPARKPLPQAKVTHPALEVLTANGRKLFGLMEASRKRGLEAARAGDPKAFAQINAILDTPASKINPQSLRGNWQCRTFALGGTLGPKFAATKTGFFRCRITRDGKHLKLRKTSGSMGWLGWLRVLDDERLLYYGTAIAIDDIMPIYPKTSRFSSHQVGLVQQMGANRLRIEMPMPRHSASSFHDVVELVREARRRK
ncbi:MAG: DUF4893 domain-containing protein [Beijerinckiaceae bacterium]|nr:DUF4893 domain-containing protein [Beijerinckiaceae bacterium]